MERAGARSELETLVIPRCQCFGRREGPRHVGIDAGPAGHALRRLYRGTWVMVLTAPSSGKGAVAEVAASDPLDRREFLRLGLTAGATLGLRSVLGVIPGALPTGAVTLSTAPRRGVREFRLIAEAGDVEVAPGQVYRTWLYNGRFPGPELRVREGERLRVRVENRLPEGTSVHWHGVPVPNPMDGVPGLTQDPIASGSSFVYEYEAAPGGSYLYHSHSGLQIDRGLLGALLIEERHPPAAYDREYTIVLDDLLLQAPGMAVEQGDRMSRHSMAGMMCRVMGRGNMRGMMADAGTPSYRALLVNGRTPSDPPAFEVRRGERVRLRLLNPSGATTFRVALAGHPLTVTHSDGRPIEPVTVDALLVGMGERYDVLVNADNPGTWALAAASVEGGPEAPARAVLRYAGVRAGADDRTADPEGLASGRLLALDDLIATDPLPVAAGRPDRTFDLTLSGGMMSPAWAINGQTYPNAEPLEIQAGEWVQVRMSNMSMMMHPMHLHGHFFRVGRAMKDTVLVPPHMGRVTFDFMADNPGQWLFHCHNLYHMERGMARAFRYV